MWNAWVNMKCYFFLSNALLKLFNFPPYPVCWEKWGEKHLWKRKSICLLSSLCSPKLFHFVTYSCLDGRSRRGKSLVFFLPFSLQNSYILQLFPVWLGQLEKDLLSFFIFLSKILLFCNFFPFYWEKWKRKAICLLPSLCSPN